MLFHKTSFWLLLAGLVSGVLPQVSVENAFPGLIFNRPVDFQHAGDGSGRLFVVEQRGLISLIDASRTAKSTFLDIQNRVNDSGNEEGLLGLAFHPDFANNGYFYVDYTAANPDRTVIARYSVSSANPNMADENSEFVLLEQPQPFSNHNGGQIAFGPDGYLYIAFGDGGSGGDPQGNGQNRRTLLGSICRIDVNSTQGDLNYTIPPDNPFAGNSEGWREEIYAYGLRNPWRISFDPVTGWLWAGDVGQNRLEEIDVIEKGKNYGWNTMEGTSCYDAGSCDTTGLTLPVWEYGRNLGASVSGGHVYRGESVPELTGLYIYADFVSGRIWTLRYDGGAPENELLMDTELNISSFGLDADNELYLCAFDGNIYTFESTSTGVADQPDKLPLSIRLGPNYPNPFNPTTRIPFNLPAAQYVTLFVYNVHGKLVRTLVDGMLSAGRHDALFEAIDDSGRTLPSGVYVAELRAGDVVLKSRLVLLR